MHRQETNNILLVDDHPIILAALTGLISGLLISIPVGPVNLTIINEGSRRGFRWAMFIGLGAISMEPSARAERRRLPPRRSDRAS